MCFGFGSFTCGIILFVFGVADGVFCGLLPGLQLFAGGSLGSSGHGLLYPDILILEGVQHVEPAVQNLLLPVCPQDLRGGIFRPSPALASSR